MKSTHTFVWPHTPLFYSQISVSFYSVIPRNILFCFFFAQKFLVVSKQNKNYNSYNATSFSASQTRVLLANFFNSDPREKKQSRHQGYSFGLSTAAEERLQAFNGKLTCLTDASLALMASSDTQFTHYDITIILQRHVVVASYPVNRLQLVIDQKSNKEQKFHKPSNQ